MYDMITLRVRVELRINKCLESTSVFCQLNKFLFLDCYLKWHSVYMHTHKHTHCAVTFQWFVICTVILTQLAGL